MERTLIEAKYHNFLLKSNKRLMLLYGFGLLLTYPLLLFFCRNLTNVYSLKLIGQTINMLLAILGSLLIPLLMYRHTTTKNSLDVYDALPLQKESMFRIHFFAGFTILLLPLAISFLLGFIYTILNSQPEILLTSSYLMKPSVSYELIHFLEASVALLASYSIAVFTKQNCGTTIDAFIYTIVINLTPILTYLAIFSYCNATLLGFAEPFSTDFFLYLTPFPMMFNYFLNIPGIVSVPRFWYFIILSIVLYIFASQLYVNHASEKAETPFMNTRFFPIVSYIITIVSMILLYSSLQYPKLVWTNGFTQFVYPMLIGCIFYLVLDVIANRGFAHILKAALNFLVIAVIVVATLIPINVTKGFGYVTRIPDIENIQSVAVNLPWNMDQLMNLGNKLVFTKEEEIAQIVSFHETILEKYRDYNYSSDYLYHQFRNEDSFTNSYPFDVSNQIVDITFEYDNKVGKQKRSYAIPLAWTYELTQMALSDGANTSRIATLDKLEEDDVIQSIYLQNTSYNESISLDKNNFDMELFTKYLKEDMENLTNEEFYEGIHTDFGIIEIRYSSPSLLSHNNQGYGNEMRIKSSYTKTIQYLESLGVSAMLPTITPDENTSIHLVYPSKETNSSFHVLSDGYAFDYSYETQHQYKELPLELFDQIAPYLQTSAMYKEAGFLVTVSDKYDYREYIISPKMADFLNDLTKDLPTLNDLKSYEFK